jgi:enoyl-CoA hydratase/carnithine racemase
MSQEILVSRAGGIVTITLNRPEKRNALNATMIDQLVAAFDAVSADSEVRVVVLRAEGPTFCAGLDLSEMARQRDEGEADLGGLEVALERVEGCPHPTVAAVKGDAVAGGCELALHCDIRVAADDARFSLPVARFGLAVPVLLTWKLVDTIGAAKTCELIFTGEGVAAEAARDLGMANRVVPADELDSAVLALAQQIERNAPLSVRAMKAFVQRAMSLRRDALPREDLEAMHRQVRASDDLQEGLAARREKRPPAFRGR